MVRNTMIFVIIVFNVFVVESREKKKSNERELEKACKLNLTEKIKEVVQCEDADLVPNLNAGMEDYWTPLHFAAFYGNTPVCNLLILKDAAIDQRNNLQ